MNNILPSWNEGNVKNKIIDFVTAAVDEKSPDFIPIEDRIVVTDIDGTLIAERGIKVDNDKMCHLTPKEAKASFVNMLDDYFDYEKRLTYRNYIYKPMIELYEYLKANDFEIFFVSGNCNSLTYALANYFFGADYAHCIGSIVELKIDDSKGYELVPTGGYTGAWCEEKCYRIYNQIGNVPVLGFGNSDGDEHMLRWIAANKNYRSLACVINHTDEEREYAYNIEELSSLCDKYNLLNVDMKETFKTVF